MLSTFIFEPIRWNARFGWRPMCETERLAMFHFWRAVGERMNIKDIPADYAAFERFNIDYETAALPLHRGQPPRRRRDARDVRGLVSAAAAAAGAPAMYAIMDDPVLDGFGFPKPSPAMRALGDGGAACCGRGCCASCPPGAVRGCAPRCATAPIPAATASRNWGRR